MPHFTLEYSANLETEIEFQSLFAQVHQVLADSKVFPLAGIRSRAICMHHYRIADGKHDYAFVHMSLKIGSGRELAVQQQVAEQVFAVISTYFEPIQARRLLAITFEMQEVHPVLSYKKNNIHQFLQKQNE